MESEKCDVDDETWQTPKSEIQEFKPIESVNFISPDTHHVKRSVGANIMPNGDLVISGLDWGDEMSSDYEYSVTIEACHKDSGLLLLLGEQFTDFPPAKEWLEKAGVPFKAWHWG